MPSKKLSEAQRYEASLMAQHDKAPATFNPQFDPKAKARSAQVSASMEADGFYDKHTREECKAEWRRRYDALKAQDEATLVTCEGPRRETWYPLFEDHKDKCPSRIYTGELIKYRCGCDAPRACPGVQAVAAQAAAEQQAKRERIAAGRPAINDVIYWVRGKDAKGKDRVPMYFKGQWGRNNEDGMRGDVKGRPIHLGNGQFTGTYGMHDFEDEDGNPIPFSV
jgi:hypothetical protein